jgi:hypothetical protein
VLLYFKIKLFEKTEMRAREGRKEGEYDEHTISA